MSEVAYYDLFLTTLGNLFIGCGKDISSFEYIQSDNNDFHYNKKVSFINQDILFKDIIENDLITPFTNFISGPKKKDSMKEFLNSHSMSFAKYLEKGEIPCVSNSLQNISLFIRNGNGEYYIPGSSVKGSIIMALQNPIYNNDIPLYSKSISISDSDPFPSNSFIIDYIRHINFKRQNDPNEFNKNVKQLIQFCKEGIKIHFKLTIRHDNPSIIVNNIKKALEDFNLVYYNSYLIPHFSTNPDMISHINPNNRRLIRLGGFTNRNSKGYPVKSGEGVVSPICIKLSYSNGKYKENGFCEYEIVELK
jgi:hypothetical protein